MTEQNMDEYLGGLRLYGDDFSDSEIQQWFVDEAEAYAELGSQRRQNYVYGYHALNIEHGFRYLPNEKFEQVLSLGGAYGDEMIPILKRIGDATILEPSEKLKAERLDDLQVKYVKPDPLGQLPFEDKSFDLILCLGTLHHIPNVSKVVKEMFRCLKPGKHALVREPIVTMGDWRFPRKGLTRRERGIPLSVFHSIVQSAQFDIVRESLCQFSLTSRLRFLVRKPVYNSKAAVLLDKFLANRVFKFNYNYHPKSQFQRLRPISVFFVLRRPM